MKRLKIKTILLSLKKYLPLIIITVLAVFLRLYLFEKRVSFDADQEEIAFKAKEILSGNPVLLGPKTSLGGFSIGPGFTYLWAIFSFILKGDPLAGAYLSVLLGVIFNVGVYLIAGKLFSKKVAVILSLLVAISVNFISWDQNPWAPSLFYLAELLLFYGVYLSAKSKMGLPIAAIGIGLGIQSHFAIFLLFLPMLLYLLIFRPLVDRKNIFVSLLIIAVSVLPLVIFDMTHGFINAQRLLSIFTLGREGLAPTKAKLILTLVSNSSAIFWLHFSIILKTLIFASLVIFSVWGIYKNKIYRSLLVLSNLLLFIPFFIFLFYRSSFSEYYLMTAVVPFLFLLGYLFFILKSKIVILLILGIFAFLNIKSFIYIYKPMNLHAKKLIVQEIIEKGGKDGYGVSLSTELGYHFGYSYIFSYYQASPNIPPLKDQKRVFTIIAPAGYRGIESMTGYDGIGLRWEGVDN